MANAFLLDGIPEVVRSKVGHTESEHRVRRLFVVRVKITFCAAGVQKRCQILAQRCLDLRPGPHCSLLFCQPIQKGQVRAGVVVRFSHNALGLLPEAAKRRQSEQIDDGSE